MTVQLCLAVLAAAAPAVAPAPSRRCRAKS